MPNLFKQQPWGYRKPPLGAQLNSSHPLAKGLVCGLLLNEGGGGTVYDVSNNNNAATLVGGATWDKGLFGGAIKLNGTTGYLNIAAANNMGMTTNFSISCWVNLSSLKNYNCVATRGNGTPTDDIEIYSASVAAGITYVNNRGNGGTLNSTSNSGNNGFGNAGWGNFTAAVWQHMVVTFSSGTVTLYLNGVKKGGASGGNNPLATGTNWIFGYSKDATFSSAGFLNGKLDVPLVYNRTLLAAEVQQLYIEPFAFMQPGRGIILSPNSVAITNPGYVYIGRYF